MTATKSLRLPTTYRPKVKIEGHVPDYRGELIYVELQLLHSGTGGHMTVYARRTSQTGVWEEIVFADFKKDAEGIVSQATELQGQRKGVTLNGGAQ
jgi:hypothetical protein